MSNDTGGIADTWTVRTVPTDERTLVPHNASLPAGHSGLRARRRQQHFMERPILHFVGFSSAIGGAHDIRASPSLTGITNIKNTSIDTEEAPIRRTAARDGLEDQRYLEKHRLEDMHHVESKRQAVSTSSPGKAATP